ncbi:hypothetical protein M404DRAFT_1005682 [Pisolithus tinctorius Marx 270]|uniref:Uncharacterized protein n=1 Tax=Pisolithus tinctorius Marx 270 TaxID=870435 RepID=A0A0C3NRS7_PISTI|nr:hypothetical protein M404DRAFT_1007469 [Pisolithus tinctorius Marx 270]KIN97993.1 hypothetical protein M404DRAFT_1005682 [Pisolithus tinctorius Marx 270]
MNAQTALANSSSSRTCSPHQNPKRLGGGTTQHQQYGPHRTKVSIRAMCELSAEFLAFEQAGWWDERRERAELLGRTPTWHTKH